MRKDILAPNVDIGLLRKQRDQLLRLLNLKDFQISDDNDDNEAYNALMEVMRTEEINGLINLLDEMLDIGEGFVKPTYIGDEYAYKTIEDYEKITQYNVNEPFRIGWDMARILNKQMGITEEEKSTEQPAFQCMICCIYYTQSQILEANNPFDASDVIYGCPGCFSINKHQKIK